MAKDGGHVTFWELNREYIADRGRMCLVCGEKTRDQVAPLGIVSGRVACHLSHDDEAIRRAWLRWAAHKFERDQATELVP